MLGTPYAGYAHGTEQHAVQEEGEEDSNRVSAGSELTRVPGTRRLLKRQKCTHQHSPDSGSQPSAALSAPSSVHPPHANKGASSPSSLNSSRSQMPFRQHASASTPPSPHKRTTERDCNDPGRHEEGKVSRFANDNA